MELHKRTYSEKSLVDKLCTDAQKASYEKKGKFASGKHKSMFLDKLSTYCEYEYDKETKQYTITNLYDTPQTMAQARLHKGIYQFLAPLILNEMINNHDENHKARLTVFDLAKKIAMVNNNYDCVKFNMEQVGAELDIPFYEMYEYFNKTDLQIDEYLRRCIKYLRSENCVIANEVHVIQTFENRIELSDNIALITKEKDVHTASDDEMDLYSRIVEKASKATKANTNYEQWYGSNSGKFKKTLKKMLEENGIDYVCRGFEMWYIDLDKCKKMLDEYTEKISLQDTVKMLGEVFKLIIDENAANRASKKSLDTSYVEHFKSLSSLTILYESEDIRKNLSEWKSRSEKLREKGNNIIVDYKEAKNMDGERTVV